MSGRKKKKVAHSAPPSGPRRQRGETGFLTWRRRARISGFPKWKKHDQMGRKKGGFPGDLGRPNPGRSMKGRKAMEVGEKILF